MTTVARSSISDPHRLIERFRTAVDLWATGVMIRRQTIRRNRPDASAEEVDSLLNQWLQERPGAEYGDGPQPEEPQRS
jgi:hypothetical protein